MSASKSETTYKLSFRPGQGPRLGDFGERACCSTKPADDHLPFLFLYLHFSLHFVCINDASAFEFGKLQQMGRAREADIIF